MNSSLAALTWEIWRRGRRSARLAIGCVSLCVLMNLAIPLAARNSETGRDVFPMIFGLLMTLSFLLLMGVFNCTEYNSKKEWNGFPYRHFVLPVPTWRLVALPMILGIVTVELIYVAWIKLVWTHTQLQIPMPEWFAAVLGAYMVFYQTAIWSLAGFRIVRVIALSLGGVSAVGVAILPQYSQVSSSPWFSEKRLILIMIGLTILAFVVAWAAVARQRCGGGQRRAWIKVLMDRLLDAIPRRTKDFASPTAAQFWCEWRRAGWVLPACTALVIITVFVPVSSAWRHDPKYTVDMLVKLLAMPIVLAFAIGKGFVKPEFWSMNLGVPSFLAVRPLQAGEYVVTKMRVAALSVVATWLVVFGFIAIWLPLFADNGELKQLLLEFRMIYPRSWQVITVLYVAASIVLSWRCLVSGLWSGLSGKLSIYVGAICAQIVLPLMFLTAAGIWSDNIDRALNENRVQVQSALLRWLGWMLAIAVILKLWLAVHSWAKITPHRTRQYLLLWSGATISFIALGVLARPWADYYHQGRIYVLVALLLFPLSRLGLAPSSLARNRHG